MTTIFPYMYIYEITNMRINEYNALIKSKNRTNML